VARRRDDVHVVGADAKFLRHDLREDGQRALPRLDGAGQERSGAVFVDLHHRGARVGRYGETDRVPHAGDAASTSLHAFAPLAFQPKRLAACTSVSLMTTLCNVCPVGLSEPSLRTLIIRISSGSIFSAL